MLQHPLLLLLDDLILGFSCLHNIGKTIPNRLSSTFSLTSPPSLFPAILLIRQNPFWPHSPPFSSIIRKLGRICNPAGFSLENARFNARPRHLKPGCIRHRLQALDKLILFTAQLGLPTAG